MRDIQRFITGFRTFHEDYFGSKSSIFNSLKDGQSPKTMIIGCSDSRVDPALLTDSEPGDVFIVRNVANLVPPFEENGGRHGVSAALEFAICCLGVEQIIVLGHSQCGGINALMNGGYESIGSGFISRWMSIAAPARERILKELPGKDPKTQQRAAELASIIPSLENLHSFPFVMAKLNAKQLSIYGWYFDLSNGDLLGYEPESREFVRLNDGHHPVSGTP
jgi:carbonic anhydrase